MEPVDAYLWRLPGWLAGERLVWVSSTVQHDHHSFQLQSPGAVTQSGWNNSKTSTKNRVYWSILGCYGSRCISAPVKVSDAPRSDLGSKSTSHYHSAPLPQTSGAHSSMAACTYLIQHARVHLRRLQGGLASVNAPYRHLDSVLHSRGNFVLFGLGDKLSNICVGVPFVSLQPMFMLVTDASFLGCGACIKTLQTQGLWSSQDLRTLINVRELWAICLTCYCAEKILSV